MAKVLSEKVRDLIEIEEKMKILSDRSKEIRKEILDELPDEGVTVWAIKVIRVSKKMFSLKEWVSEVEMMGKFPMAVKSACDFTELKKIPEAHQYLDMTLSSYVKMWTITAQDGGH